MESRKDVNVNLKDSKVGGEAVIASKRFKGTPSVEQEAGSNPVTINVNSENTEFNSLDIAGAYYSS